MIYLSSASKEFLRTTVSGKRAGRVLDPTSDPVFFAFLPEVDLQPTGTDWVAGEWEVVATTFVARCLVGPGGAKELAPGTYYAWIKISDSLETPVRAFDVVRVE